MPRIAALLIVHVLCCGGLPCCGCAAGEFQDQPLVSGQGATASAAEKSDKETLELTGAFTMTSQPLPFLHGTESREIWIQRFGQDTIRDLLLSGGGAQQLLPIDRTDDYDQLWDNKLREIPNDHHFRNQSNAQLLVTNIEVRFPGLRVVTASLTGVSQVWDKGNSSQSSTLPRYEFCLLAQSQVAYGFPLSVRIFNQITGNVNRTRNVFYPVSGSSLSQASLVEHPENKSLAIFFDCWVHLEYPFPRFLLRLLPFAKSRVEKIISRGLVKAAKKEVANGVNAAWNAMMDETVFEMNSPVVSHSEL